MHIWLVQVGEPLPTDPGKQRLLRTGLLAEELVRRGHRVTWWASTFRHSNKRQRAEQNTILDVTSNYRIMLIHSPGYFSNVSFSRFRDHRLLGENFRTWAREESPPDMIKCGFPTIEMAYEAGRYARAHAIPFVLDARDMWPDIYVDAAPKPVRWLARVVLNNDFRMTKSAFRDADAITGHAPGFVEWGLSKAGREPSKFDISFPFAYSAQAPNVDEIATAQAFWNAQGLSNDSKEFLVCFFGTFAERREVDLSTVLAAAKLLQSTLPRVKFVLCGTGPAFERYREAARGVSNVLLPGWIDAPRIWTLMRRSRLGLLPYLPSVDFLASMPNKSIEYLSADLPIITSLAGGYLEQVLKSADCGIFYEGQKGKSLADAVARAYGDKSRVESMRTRARQLFETQFRSEVVYKEMAEHLELIARTRRQLRGIDSASPVT